MRDYQDLELTERHEDTKFRSIKFIAYNADFRWGYKYRLILNW